MLTSFLHGREVLTGVFQGGWQLTAHIPPGRLAPGPGRTAERFPNWRRGSPAGQDVRTQAGTMIHLFLPVFKSSAVP